MSNGPEEKAEQAGAGGKVRLKERSPNYPVMDLGKALEKATILHGEFRTHEIPIGMAHERCGYKSLSGAGNQCIAALKAYGLVNVTGQSDQRKVSVSMEGDRIIRNAPDRIELLKSAALKPMLHRELWDHYREKGGVPVDDLLRHYLVWDRPEPRFNEKSVGGFIADFRATLKLSGLEKGGIIDDEKPLEDGDNGPHPPVVGDYVQWTPHGVCQFAELKKILGVSDDGLFAFVEGTQTGLPMDQLSIQPAPDLIPALPVIPIAAKQPPTNPFFVPRQPEDEQGQVGVAKERATLDEGPVVLTWPDKLSKESVEELEYWLQGVIRRARRKAGLPPPKDEGKAS